MLRQARRPKLSTIALSMAGGMAAAPSVAVEWQVARMRVDGVPLEVRAGDIPVAQPLLAAAVAARWQAAGGKAAVAVSRSELADGRVVLGRQRGRMHQTITLSPQGAGRTRVLVAVNDLGASTVKPARPPVRLPVGQRLMRVVEHGDGGLAPRTFVIASGHAPQLALSQWHRALTAAGWRPRSLGPIGAGPRASLLWADRGRGRIDAVFSPAPDGARIVLQVSGDAR